MQLFSEHFSVFQLTKDFSVSVPPTQATSYPDKTGSRLLLTKQKRQSRRRASKQSGAFSILRADLWTRSFSSHLCLLSVFLLNEHTSGRRLSVAREDFLVFHMILHRSSKSVSSCKVFNCGFLFLFLLLR